MNVRDIYCRECGAPAGKWCTLTRRQTRTGKLWHLLRAKDARDVDSPNPTDPRTLAQRVADFNAAKETT